MNHLRRRLLQECEPLHAALENSWAIANNDGWLSSINISAGSYNAAPHFRNIEAHLEKLLIPSSASGHEGEWSVALSPLELYLLLASVLFHDYGRVQQDANHAYASSKYLPELYSSLGIPSYDLAFSLAHICLYHDPVRKLNKKETAKLKKSLYIRGMTDVQRAKKLEVKMKELRDADVKHARESLSDLTIEPYGRARELRVATLLALADHLDASVKRTEPYFVRTPGDIGLKGAFRRMVTGSQFDPATRCIKTCLRDQKNAFVKEVVDHFTLSLYDDDGEEVLRGKNLSQQRSCEVRINRPDPLFSPTNASSLGQDIYTAMDIAPQVRRCLYSLTLQDKCRLERREPHGQVPWPTDYLLAVVLHDLRNNRSFLNDVRDDLKDIGLPVDDWLVEYHGKTYNHSGLREEEPVFRTDDFKKLVAEHMEELSRYGFAHSGFTYEVLADSLRTDDVPLVKLAVQQLVRDEGHYIDNDGIPQLAFSKKSLQLRALPETWQLRMKKASAPQR